MALEVSRGDRRHGSCGMGINECSLRTKAGYGLTLREAACLDAQELYRKLSFIRNSYYCKQRLPSICRELNSAASEYMALLSDDNVIINAAEQIAFNVRYVKILTDNDLKATMQSIDTLIFESGQGLLLSCDNSAQSPNVTASLTGLDNPCSFLSRFGIPLDEVVYVSRSYVTRHGAGMLNGECAIDELGTIGKDLTNEPNEWQGKIRYAPHESEANFVADVSKDLFRNINGSTCVSLFLTHLNETGNTIVFKDRRVPVESFIRHPLIRNTFDKFYFSASHFSEEATSSIPGACAHI